MDANHLNEQYYEVPQRKAATRVRNSASGLDQQGQPKRRRTRRDQTAAQQQLFEQPGQEYYFDPEYQQYYQMTPEQQVYYNYQEGQGYYAENGYQSMDPSSVPADSTQNGTAQPPEPMSGTSNGAVQAVQVVQAEAGEEEEEGTLQIVFKPKPVAPTPPPPPPPAMPEAMDHQTSYDMGYSSSSVQLTLAPPTATETAHAPGGRSRRRGRGSAANTSTANTAGLDNTWTSFDSDEERRKPGGGAHRDEDFVIKSTSGRRSRAARREETSEMADQHGGETSPMGTADSGALDAEGGDASFVPGSETAEKRFMSQKYQKLRELCTVILGETKKKMTADEIFEYGFKSGVFDSSLVASDISTFLSCEARLRKETPFDREHQPHMSNKFYYFLKENASSGVYSSKPGRRGGRGDKRGKKETQKKVEEFENRKLCTDEDVQGVVTAALCAYDHKLRNQLVDMINSLAALSGKAPIFVDDTPRTILVRVTQPFEHFARVRIPRRGATQSDVLAKVCDALGKDRNDLLLMTTKEGDENIGLYCDEDVEELQDEQKVDVWWK